MLPWTLLERQIRRFSPRCAALNDEAAADELRRRIRDLKSVEVLGGAEGVLAISDYGRGGFGAGRNWWKRGTVANTGSHKSRQGTWRS